MKKATAQIQSMRLPKQSTIKTVVLIALSVLVICTALYVFFVSKIVFDIVGQRVAENNIHTLQSSVGNLETTYFNQLKTLDLARAETDGLTESQDTLYASRDDASSKTVGFLQ